MGQLTVQLKTSTAANEPRLWDKSVQYHKGVRQLGWNWNGRNHGFAIKNEYIIGKGIKPKEATVGRTECFRVCGNGFKRVAIGRVARSGKVQWYAAADCRHLPAFWALYDAWSGGWRTMLSADENRDGWYSVVLLACWIFSEAHSSGDVTPKRPPIGQLLLAESAWKFELTSPIFSRDTGFGAAGGLFSVENRHTPATAEKRRIVKVASSNRAVSISSSPH
ncbi:hypothetical protein CIRG_08811 [Coccidioides immitis RMSCC 2394]|uniref:Uncharacterized protein n=1 Tax=Coccidioides immitis RMSCC 2394 TaxID=404692 RepID=A0A0J6YPK5_COCIT|nr:hypothetical protein CIRG_08811 [Coccidioides immitis RMSCC 2394]